MFKMWVFGGLLHVVLETVLGETHLKTSSATMEQNKVRNKAEHLLTCAMLHEVQPLWALLVPPRDLAQAWS